MIISRFIFICIAEMLWNGRGGTSICEGMTLTTDRPPYRWLMENSSWPACVSLMMGFRWRPPNEKSSKISCSKSTDPRWWTPVHRRSESVQVSPGCKYVGKIGDRNDYDTFLWTLHLPYWFTDLNFLKFSLQVSQQMHLSLASNI